MLKFLVNKDGDKEVGLVTHGFEETRIEFHHNLINLVDGETRGFNRIVVGDRGPYVEFLPGQIDTKDIHIPEKELWRLHDRRVYYIEFRTRGIENVMVYYQLRTVSYADYKIGMFYISPYDLYLTNGRRIICGKDGEVFRENPKLTHFF